MPVALWPAFQSSANTTRCFAAPSYSRRTGARPLSTTTYGYNAQSGRLETVSDGTYSATYSYLANSPLMSQITFKQNTTVRMTTSKQYDKLNRLLSISSAPSGTGILPVSGVWQKSSPIARA
jgi:hypothetical protein